MLYLPFTDIHISYLLLLLAGISTGVVIGFFGVSGSLILTPLLNFFGLSAGFAIGTNLTLLFGQSVLTTVKNSALKSVLWRFVFILGIAGMGGAYLGNRLLLSPEYAPVRDQAVRIVYAAILFGIAALMTFDRFRAKNPAHYGRQFDRISWLAGKIKGIHAAPMVLIPDSGGNSISLWLLVALGAVCGFLSGGLGLSGSFIRIPFLVFVLGLPMLSALCTDILVMSAVTGAGAVFFAGEGFTEPVAALLLLLSVGIGSKAGFAACHYTSRSRAKFPFIAGITAFAGGVVALQLNHPLAAALFIPGTLLLLALYIALSALAGLLYCRKHNSGAQQE
jgi:uncharacterized membrane protein YfcA